MSRWVGRRMMGLFLEPLSNVVDWLGSDAAGPPWEGLFLLVGLEVAMNSSVFAAGWGASFGMIALGGGAEGRWRIPLRGLAAGIRGLSGGA